MTKEFLIFARKRWEIAHTEENSVTGVQTWIRRDQSWICNVGDEMAIADLPPKPKTPR